MKDIWTWWQTWALLSAFFAACTAIFAKLGVSDINADFATLIRTVVILAAAALFVWATHQWQPFGSVSARGWVFLVLSGLATGASWFCYFRALKLGDASSVAPVDKLSVVLVALFAALLLGERQSPIGWLGILLIALGSALIAARL